MINILLILAFVGAVVISGIFAGVTFLQSVRSTVEAQITRQRLLDTAVLVQAQARYVSGKLALPQGSTGSSPYPYNQVPSWVSPNAKSASGVPFLYCPYRSSGDTGTASTVTLPDATTYAVKYTSSASTLSANYVTGGDAPPGAAPAGTLGLLIAPSPQSFNTPNCDDIAAQSDGTITVSGGLVAVIQDNYLNRMKVATSASELRFYIAAAATGDGSGRDTNNYITIGNAMALINYAKPAQATLVIPSGGTTMPTTVSTGGILHIQGAGQWSSQIITTTNDTLDETSTLTISDALLYNSGTFTIHGELHIDAGRTEAVSGINVYGGRFTAIGSGGANFHSFRRITIDAGGELIVGNSTVGYFQNLGDRQFKIINGVYSSDTSPVYFRPNADNVTPIYIGAGGVLQSSGYVYINDPKTYTVKGGMIVDPGGKFGLSRQRAALVYKARRFAYYVHGLMNVCCNSYMAAMDNPSGLDYGIVLASGGALAVSQNDNTDIVNSNTNAPSIGIYDNGANRWVTDTWATTGRIDAKTDCWHGRSGTNLFSDPFAGTNNGTATNHVSYTANSSGWQWLRLHNQSYARCTKDP